MSSRIKEHQSEVKVLKPLFNLYGKSETIPFDRLNELENKYRNARIFQDFKKLLDLKRILLEKKNRRVLEKIFLQQPTASLNHAQIDEKDLLKTSHYLMTLLNKVHEVMQDSKHPFHEESRELVAVLSKNNPQLFDAMDKRFSFLNEMVLFENGLHFFVLSQLKLGQSELARTMVRRAVSNPNMNIPVVSLYWLTEIFYFLKKINSHAPLFSVDALDFIYPYVLTEPFSSRLFEVSTPFSDNRKNIVLLAKEAHSFKDELVYLILGLWEKFRFGFDSVFESVLNALLGLDPGNQLSPELVVKMGEVRGTFSNRALSLVLDGNELFYEKKFSEALESFEKAIQCEPHEFTLQVNRWMALASLGQGHQVLVELNTFLETNVSLSSFELLKVACCLVKIGEISRAKELIDQASSKADLRYYFALFCFEERNLETGFMYAQSAFEQSPASHTRWLFARYLFQLGKHDDVLDLLHSAPRKESRSELMFMMFLALRASGQGKKAAEVLAQVSKQDLSFDEKNEAREFALQTGDLALFRKFKEVV